MKKNNRLVILNGKIARDSFLSSQLQLNTVFDLTVQKKRFYGDLAEDFPRLFSESLFYKNDQEVTKSGDILKIIKELGLDGQEQLKVAIFPARIAFHSFKEVENVVLNAFSAVDDCRVKLKSAAIEVFDLKTLKKHSHQEVKDIEAEEISYTGESSDLSEPLGIFNYSFVQTSTRYINTFQKKGAFITKKCSLKEKGKAEYQFLDTLPKSLRPYYPVVGESQQSAASFDYEIEFVPLFDLSRHLIHKKFTVDDFSEVLGSLETYFSQLPQKTVSKDEYQKLLRELLIDKLFRRMEQLRSLKDFNKLNALCYLNFNKDLTALAQELSSELEKAIRQQSGTSFHYIHGDLCFSNILWDRVSGRLKLIDPNGALPEGYAPLVYDLCKLSHSLSGGYDLIMNKCVRAELQTDLSFELNFGSYTKNLHAMEELFFSRLSKMGITKKFIKLAEASLFFSMLPLHQDQPDCMVLQMLAGEKAFRVSRELK